MEYVETRDLEAVVSRLSRHFLTPKPRPERDARLPDPGSQRVPLDRVLENFLVLWHGDRCVCSCACARGWSHKVARARTCVDVFVARSEFAISYFSRFFSVADAIHRGVYNLVDFRVLLSMLMKAMPDQLARKMYSRCLRAAGGALPRWFWVQPARTHETSHGQQGSLFPSTSLF